MFKLESYITPWLLSYIDQYVKLRREDFQLSLWGGDVVLNNLELRLASIQKLVPTLPIIFQSGLIHELRIHVGLAFFERIQPVESFLSRIRFHGFESIPNRSLSRSIKLNWSLFWTRSDYQRMIHPRHSRMTFLLILCSCSNNSQRQLNNRTTFRMSWHESWTMCKSLSTIWSSSS